MTQFCKLGRWILAIAATIAVAGATEKGASVYPTGAETVMPGLMPATGGSVFEEFNNFYQANALVGANGVNLVPGFHLRVAAAAAKLVHNWGLHLLGGELVSSAAVPVLYEHLSAPFGKGDKSGIGNADIGVAAIAYHKKAWHWWYGLEEYLPGAQYNKTALLNVGQHNFATAVDGAFTYMPRSGEVSSKFQYIVNCTDPATQYRSGGEFIWEYDAMRNLNKKLALGFNGYYYQQLTDDRQNGLQLAGTRARSLAVGPEIRYHLGRTALIVKYQRETLAENKTSGNSFWMQLGLPLGHRE